MRARASGNIMKSRETPHVLVLAAALHERPIPASWLDHLGVSDDEVDQLLASLALAETPGGFQLGAASEADAVIGSASWSARRRVRLALAGACLLPPPQYELAARHFEAAGKNGEASHAWLVAAEAHCRRHKHTAAAPCFEAGLRILPEDTPDADVARIMRNLTQCAALSDNHEQGIALLSSWTETPPWSGRTGARAEGLLALATLYEGAGRHGEAGLTRLRAGRDLSKLGCAASASTAALAAANTLAYALQLTPAGEAARLAIASAHAAGDERARAEAMQIHGLILGMLGVTNEARIFVEQSLDLALNHKFTGEAANAYRLLGTVSEYASCYVDEQESFARALTFCRKSNQTAVAGLCMGCLSYSLFRSGNWKRSERTTRLVLSATDAHPVSKMVAQGVLGLLEAHRGETRPAVKNLDACLASSRAAGIAAMEFFCRLGLAITAEAQGKEDEQHRQLRGLLDFWKSTEDRHDAIPGLSVAVTSFARAGRGDEAAEAAEALEQIASLTANREAAGAAHAAAAELALLRGEAASSVKLFRRALAAYGKRDLPIELSRTHGRLAVALNRNGCFAESGEVFADALRQARRLGARTIAARIEADRSGDQESDATAGGWDLLTERQREVARQLACGSTNKEIAVALGLSTRTVDMHVAHILARLDCRTRAAASARITAALC